MPAPQPRLQTIDWLLAPVWYVVLLATVVRDTGPYAASSAPRVTMNRE